MCMCVYACILSLDIASYIPCVSCTHPVAEQYFASCDVSNLDHRSFVTTIHIAICV